MAKSKSKTKARTQVCFLLDETQSMYQRKDETIKGFNGYLEELKKDKGDEVLFTFTTFNRGGVKTHYKAEPIKNVKPLTNETYNPQNWTPLYDAIGTTVCAIQDQVGKEDLVIFVILTDGEENSSHEYDKESITRLIKKHETEGWKFTYLGVDVDAFAGSSQIGIKASSAFTVAPQNVDTVYECLSMGTTEMRAAYSTGGIQATAMMSVLNEKDRKKLQD